MNDCKFMGRLGADPHGFDTRSGKGCSFDIAIDESYTDKQGNKAEKVSWIRILAFGKLAGLCLHHLKKGKLVHVETKASVTKKDGGYVTNFILQRQPLEGISQSTHGPKQKEGFVNEHTPF